MNIFDIIGVASKIPFDLTQKLESDIPKLERLVALTTEAEPHVVALEPIAKEAEEIWASISPEILSVLKALGAK